MTKQENRNRIDSFKAVKVLITNCTLDPYYKGKLLSAINKVIKNKKSHFRVDSVTTNFATLFSWFDNAIGIYQIDWSTIGICLVSE